MEKLSADSQNVLHTLAHQYLCQGKVEKAQVLLELLTVQNPDNKEFRLALGYALLRMEKAEDAIQALAPLENSSLAIVHFVRAKALAQAGFTSESQAALDRYRLLLSSESVN